MPREESAAVKDVCRDVLQLSGGFESTRRVVTQVYAETGGRIFEKDEE